MMKKRGWLLARGWYLSKKCRPEEGAGIWQNHRGNLTPQPTATPRPGPPTTHDVSRPFSIQLGHPGTCTHSQRILLRPLHRLQALREPHFFARPGPMTRFCPTKLWLVAVDSDKIRLLPPNPRGRRRRVRAAPAPQFAASRNFSSRRGVDPRLLAQPYIPEPQRPPSLHSPPRTARCSQAAALSACLPPAACWHCQLSASQ